MIKRSSKKYIDKQIEQNPNWKILDIGCGFRAHPRATTIADIQNFSDFYKGREFIKINEKKLPFKDNEFDFLICSHVIEHVEDFEFFIKEMERISLKGYIELPTRLGDNLVFENKKDHIWWFLYDDVNSILLASKKNQLIDPFITVSTAKILERFFRESLVMELYWEKKIDYLIDNSLKQENEKRISFFKLVKKFFSKKIRSILK